ncbi:MAG: hypothetical protein ACJ74Q_01925 [Pyrinomonadaceae bacterium]
MKKAILLLTSLLVFNSISVSQTKPPQIDLTTKRNLTIVYKNGVQIELTHWYWYYNGYNNTAVNDLLNARSDPLSKKKKPSIPENPDKYAINLILNMKALNVEGVSLNDIELSENQFSSIKFIWKDKDDTSIMLEKVIVSLTTGKTIELPKLEPPTGSADITLKGKTSVNGFSGDFSKRIDEGGYLANSAPSPIIEIRVQ